MRKCFLPGLSLFERVLPGHIIAVCIFSGIAEKLLIHQMVFRTVGAECRFSQIVAQSAQKERYAVRAQLPAERPYDAIQLPVIGFVFPAVTVVLALMPQDGSQFTGLQSKLRLTYFQYNICFEKSHRIFMKSIW